MRCQETAPSRRIAVLVLVSSLGSGGCAAELAPRNNAPVPVGSIPLIRLHYGETRSILLWSFFRDPDRDPLRFDVRASSRDPVRVTISNDSLVVRAKGAPGKGVVVVQARDPDGLSAEQEVSVEVGFFIPPSPAPPTPRPDSDSP